MVWQKYSDAETAVINEAGASATLYRLAAGPETDLVATRVALDNYHHLAIEEDWPQMSAGRGSPIVTRALNALYVAGLHLSQGQSRQVAVTSAIFTQLDAITQARRTRLYLSEGIVPRIIWVALYCGAVLTVLLHVLLRHRKSACAGVDDRNPDIDRVPRPSGYRIDRPSFHRPDAHR
ncbi:MAG: hypothetical protein WDN04_20380 [Rhodospirillales bacterium]